MKTYSEFMIHPELLQRAMKAPTTRRVLDEVSPDWVAIFPVPEVPADIAGEPDPVSGVFNPDMRALCRLDVEWPCLTPRDADLLYAGLDIAYDAVAECFRYVDFNDPVAVRDAVDLAGLPRVVGRYLRRRDVDADAWLSQFLCGAQTMKARLASGRTPSPATTAEALMLHLALDEALAALDGGYLDDFLGEIPASPFDSSVHTLAGSLFEDDDVLLLFNPRIADEYVSDSGEDVGGDGSDLLHPSGWFGRFGWSDDVSTVTAEEFAALGEKLDRELFVDADGSRFGWYD